MEKEQHIKGRVRSNRDRGRRRGKRRENPLHDCEEDVEEEISPGKEPEEGRAVFTQTYFCQSVECRWKFSEKLLRHTCSANTWQTTTNIRRKKNIKIVHFVCRRGDQFLEKVSKFSIFTLFNNDIQRDNLCVCVCVFVCINYMYVCACVCALRFTMTVKGWELIMLDKKDTRHLLRTHTVHTQQKTYAHTHTTHKQKS